MGTLDVVIDALEAQPSSVRCHVTIRRDGQRATIQRGGMQAVVRELDNSAVEVIYEHALHEVTRERVTPGVAARLLLAIIQRERLVRVEVPNTEP